MDGIISGITKDTGYKTKSGLPGLWKAKPVLSTDENQGLKAVPEDDDDAWNLLPTPYHPCELLTC